MNSPGSLSFSPSFTTQAIKAREIQALTAHTTWKQHTKRNNARVLVRVKMFGVPLSAVPLSPVSPFWCPPFW